MEPKKPPEAMPSNLSSLYTLNNKIKVEKWYRDDTQLSTGEMKVYKKEQIDIFTEQARNKKENYYGKTDRWLFRALKKFPIKENKVAIMGSATCWYESVCLAYGGKPTTIEYNKIISEHPSLKILTPGEYKNNTMGEFDAAISISSFEHDGLGRYGDPLNPNGDIFAMKELKKHVKSGGILFLSVPVGKDKIVWNVHRIYGVIRLPLLLEGWEIMDIFGSWLHKIFIYRDTKKLASYQPVFVLKNVTD